MNTITSNSVSLNEDTVKVKIVYYNRNKEKGLLVTDWDFSNTITMKQIMKKFYNLLYMKCKVINMCFGEDIGQLIINYMPDLFDYNNNSFYMHIRCLYSKINTGGRHLRYKIHNNKKLGDLVNLKKSYTRSEDNVLILRIRAEELSGEHFVKII